MQKKVLSSSGQTLVLVALLMVVLLGLLALAIDVGLIYQVRRGMQNAADAGALAAARAWCFGGPDGTYGTVEQAVAAGEDYAITRNAADAATVTPSEDNFVWTVTATREADLFFANIFGLSTTPVGATAAAKCGAATAACGLWPVAFDDSQFDDLYDESCPTTGKKPTVYIWAGYGTSQGGGTCNNRPDDPECCVPDPEDPDTWWCTGICEEANCQDPQCGVLYNCDTDGDGYDDFFTDVGRAWLDFSDVEDPDNPGGQGECPGDGCGAAELGYCIAGSPHVKLELPVCIPGDTGVKGGVKKQVATRKGQVVGIPLFEDKCVMDPGDTCSEAFDIIDFGCVEVDPHQPWQRVTLDALVDDVPKFWHGWAVAVTIHCGNCPTNCGGTGGDSPLPGPGGVRGVSLIK